MTELQEAVARSADSADLHAAAPTLLVELQTLLGALSAAVTDATDRGRRPFRPGAEWAQRLGQLAYGLYLLADQTAVDVDAAVRATAEALVREAERRRADEGDAWPFGQRA